MSETIKYNNTTIVLTQKSESKTYSTKEVIKAFMNAKSIEDFKDYVEKAKDRLYASWASVDAADTDGEHIPIQDIIKDQDILVYKRGGTITDSHTNNHVGKTLAYKVMTHPKTGTTGVLHLNKIFDDMLVDDKVWRETQTGERKGSSVGGFSNPEGSEWVDMDGSMVKRLADFRQFETANVTEPANPYATNVAVSMVAKEKKQMSNDIMKEIEQKAKGEDPVTVPADETNDSVDDSDAFVNKEEFGKLVSAVNEMRDQMAGMTSGKPQEEAEAVEGQEEEKMEDEEKGTGISALDDANKEGVGEGDDVSKMRETIKSLKAELEEIKKSQASVSQIVKASENARAEDAATNTKFVNKQKKERDLIEQAMKGSVNMDEVLYGDE